MALVDADYKFLWIDVGSDGSSNDASIYNGSQLEIRRDTLSVPCVLLYSAFYPSQDLIVEASGKFCVVVEGLPIFCPQFS
jgi:hypothetical protein